MSNFAILRVKKIKTVGNVISALKHNFRELDDLKDEEKPTNINLELTKFNLHLRPKSQEFWPMTATSQNRISSVKRAMEIYNDRMKFIKENGKIRKNAVLAMDYLIAASPEWWKKSTHEQRIAWRQKNLDWLVKRHGIENIVSCTYQVDEKSPHIQAVVIPEINGKLNARAFLGGKELLKKMQTDYANEMKEFGLIRGFENSKAKHQTIQKFYAELNKAVHEKVETNLEIKLPEPKLLEQASSYKKRVEDDLSLQNIQNFVHERNYESFQYKQKINKQVSKFKSQYINYMNEMQEKHNALILEHEKLNAEHKDLQAEHQKIIAENQMLKQKLYSYNDIQNENNMLKHQKQNLVDEYYKREDEHEAELDRVMKKNSELRNQIDEFRKENARLLEIMRNPSLNAQHNLLEF